MINSRYPVEKSVPLQLQELPKKVFDAIKYWANNTFLNENHSDIIDGYRYVVSPMYSTITNKVYAGIRVVKNSCMIVSCLIAFDTLGIK